MSLVPELMVLLRGIIRANETLGARSTGYFVDMIPLGDSFAWNGEGSRDLTGHASPQDQLGR